MFDLARTTDTELIKRAVTHPKVWARLEYDFSPSAEEFDPPLDEHIWYISVFCRGEFLGIFALIERSPVLWEIHAALLPIAWGKPSRQIFPELLDWIWEHTTCHRLIADIPDFNRSALKYAEDVGMVRWGINEAAYQKDNKLYNIVMFGISRPESIQCRC